MIAVIFEVIPKEEHRQAYFDIAASLRPLLDDIEGFISIERFASINDPKKVLSLSFWRDEAAVAKWRNMEQHRTAQTMGKTTIFEQYKISRADISRSYGFPERV